MNRLNTLFVKPENLGSPKHPLPAAVSRTYLFVGLAVVAAHAAGITGPAAGFVLPALIVGTCISVVTGIVRNRPHKVWPWLLFLASTVLFVLATLTRELTGATGVLTDDRALLPDMFAVPGLLLYSAALIGLIVDRKGAVSTQAAVLDSLVLASGVLLVCWAYILTPLLRDTEATVIAKIAVIGYVPLAVIMTALAAQLALIPGPKNMSNVYLLGLVSTMLIGEMVHTFHEIGFIGPSIQAHTLPWTLSAVFGAAAALHPSIWVAPNRAAAPTSTSKLSRLTIITFSMLVPTSLIIADAFESPQERVTAAGLSLLLAALTIARMWHAMRSQQKFDTEAARMRSTDALTKLHNRDQLMAQMDVNLASGEKTAKTAMLLLDLDNFQRVNDSLGHEAGDELLRQVATRLNQCLQPHMTIARCSGDEFAIAIMGGTETEALTYAAYLRSQFKTAFPLGTSSIVLTASIGVSSSLDTRKSSNDLLREADTALRAAKRSGRDSVVVFNKDMHAAVSRRIEIESSLREGMPLGYAETYYQPIVDLRTRHVIGVEALMRWNTPDGPLYPDEFIPVAEETGLIVELGANILRETCAQVAAWRTTLPGHHHLYASVNLSVQQIRQADVVEMIKEVLADTGFPADALWLELTETVSDQPDHELETVLQNIGALGVKLAVDDFGTGHSNLARLRALPFDRLKIDRSFVNEIETPGPNRDITAGTINMATALGLSVVAEGVENETQAEVLVRHGCIYAQGYEFSPPVPAHAFPAVATKIGGTNPAASTTPQANITAAPASAYQRKTVV